jgi:two-component system response regulator AtoC
LEAKVKSIPSRGVTPSALIVEDSGSSQELLSEWLKQMRFGAIETRGTLVDAQAILVERSFDLVLLDLQLPDGSGLELLKQLEDHPDAEVVVITGHGTIDSAIDAMRGGAIDYLTKPVDLRRLQKIVTKSCRALELRSEVASLRGELRRMGRFGSMLGASAAMQRIYDLIVRVAPTSSTVLVVGETGTGKELVAETVHQRSRRSAEPFIPVNCGAVSANLIESELFGHERGSFTGAERKHKGVFERAHGGTLFLDEITEMPMELQVRLLRILETGSLTRVGGDEVIAANVRVLAATNRDPAKAVQDGKLREDLLYRLNVFPIEVPPLRERHGDITLLAQHFLENLNNVAGTSKTFTPAALERLELHPWPGNVRELKNAIERAHIIAGARIEPDALPLRSLALSASDPTGAPGVGSSIAEVEQQLILATMARCNGNKTRAAEILGISVKTLYNKLGSYDATKHPETSQDSGPPGPLDGS